MTKNRHLPASAIPSISMSENDFPVEITSFGYSGLTKREAAAIAAMQGMLANPEVEQYAHAHALEGEPFSMAKYAAVAVRIADAIFDALEKKAVK